MSEKRPWTEQEDNLLKYVFQTSGLTKWSHIARKLQEQYGVKGRNGKQCKERYITHIDSSHAKDEWSYSDQQRMFDLHNEVGNKWAIIGSKLNGRSDNCVKNHFYSRLRKALRKINKVVQLIDKKQIKEFKPTILYKIVEVVQEKFKTVPSYQKYFSVFSNQLKNELLDFSYDDQVVQNQAQNNELDNINIDQAKELIDKINEFSSNYKKKIKKQRKSSIQTNDLLTPNRYEPVKRCISQYEESENSSRANSQASNYDDISDQQVVRTSSKRSRRTSEECSTHSLQLLDRIRTRAYSQQSGNSGEMKDEKVDQSVQKEVKQLEGALNGLNILEQDDIPPHPLMMKKETSKYSRHSDNLMEIEQYHFFQDSQIEMRILPEIDLGFRKDSQFQDNFFI